MKIKSFEISNDHLRLVVLNYGAIIHKLQYLNASNEWEDLVLTYDDIENYINDKMYIGSSFVGRNAGRIESGLVNFNSQVIQLEKNENGVNHHHGGSDNFSSAMYDVEVQSQKIILTRTDVSTTYPGTLECEITYELVDNKLIQTMNIKTDKPTFVNPTNHLYFNFNQKNSILDYNINLDCNNVWYLDQNLIPNSCMSINETPFKQLNGGKVSGIESEQFEYTKYIDHPFALNSKQVYLSNGQVELKLTTTSDYVVVYSGNFLSENNFLKLPDYYGICLETQQLPNGINIDQYSNNGVIDADTPFFKKDIYEFNIEKE